VANFSNNLRICGYFLKIISASVANFFKNNLRISGYFFQIISASVAFF